MRQCAPSRKRERLEIESPHTLSYIREGWQPGVIDHLDFHRWAAQGSTRLKQRATKNMKDFLANHREEPLPKKVIESINEIIDLSGYRRF
jgi:trimethylamine:corrinoid methyltransferase-like protein